MTCRIYINGEFIGEGTGPFVATKPITENVRSLGDDWNTTGILECKDNEPTETEQASPEGKAFHQIRYGPGRKPGRIHQKRVDGRIRSNGRGA